jgi:hypothetical protein
MVLRCVLRSKLILYTRELGLYSQSVADDEGFISGGLGKGLGEPPIAWTVQGLMTSFKPIRVWTVWKEEM